MFGYIMPFKPDLKIKYYDKFKSYYCSLCHEIKQNYGNIPRMSLNFDTSFLAILLDSISCSTISIEKRTCLVHPIEKKLIMKNNCSINYASHINTILTYNKILDDINDENKMISKLILPIFNMYIHKLPEIFDDLKILIEKELEILKIIENSGEKKCIDEFSHPFANIFKNVVSFYFKINNINIISTHYIEILGYNLGKWIYLIDAFNDLEKDINKKSFNPILNLKDVDYDPSMDITEFKKNNKDKFYSMLTFINHVCLENFKKLNTNKNYDLIENILQLGMAFKTDKIVKNFECLNNKRSVSKNEFKIF